MPFPSNRFVAATGSGVSTGDADLLSSLDSLKRALNLSTLVHFDACRIIVFRLPHPDIPAPTYPLQERTRYRRVSRLAINFSGCKRTLLRRQVASRETRRSFLSSTPVFLRRPLFALLVAYLSPRKTPKTKTVERGSLRHSYASDERALLKRHRCGSGSG